MGMRLRLAARRAAGAPLQVMKQNGSNHVILKSVSTSCNSNLGVDEHGYEKIAVIGHKPRDLLTKKHGLHVKKII